MSRTKIPVQDKAITIRLTTEEKKKFSRFRAQLNLREATAARHMVLIYMIEHEDGLTPKDFPNA